MKELPDYTEKKKGKGGVMELTKGEFSSLTCSSHSHLQPLEQPEVFLNNRVLEELKFRSVAQAGEN